MPATALTPSASLDSDLSSSPSEVASEGTDAPPPSRLQVAAVAMDTEAPIADAIAVDAAAPIVDAVATGAGEEIGAPIAEVAPSATSDEAPAPIAAASPEEPATAPVAVAAISPVAEALVLPREVEVRESQPTEADGEGEDEERTTDPGPKNEAWAGDGDEEDAAWRGGHNAALLPATQPLDYDDDMTAPRGLEERAAEANVLRARPRKTAPPGTLATVAPVPQPRARPYAPFVVAPENRPAPISLLDAPLFDDSAFVRRSVPAPAKKRSKRSAPKGWLAWLFVGAVVMLIALGWSTLRTDANAAQGRGRQAQRQAAEEEESSPRARRER